jgi:hypothetical protein
VVRAARIGGVRTATDLPVTTLFGPKGGHAIPSVRWRDVRLIACDEVAT